MPHSRGNYLLACYVVGSIALVLFSYTQVDLGLTISRINVFQSIQKSFQYIGYFRRPISSALYILITSYFFILYLWTVNLIKHQRLNHTKLWHVIIISTCIITFSYPAFSYDLFNYMFTAKTVILYHQNPYVFIPLSVSGIDPWLGFLHWTHAVSAYPPLWILFTLPIYIFGFGYFLLTLFNFKVVMSLFYLISLRYIVKSLELTDRANSLLGLALFALNPLILFEVLVSAHNDILTIAFASAAYFYYFKKEKLLSFVMLSISTAFKPMALLWIGLYVFKFRRSALLVLSSLSFLLIAGYSHYLSRDIQPWYFLIVILATALQPRLNLLTVISTGISVGLLFQYMPFLYYGNWDSPVPIIKFWGLIIPIIISLAIALYMLARRKKFYNSNDRLI